MKANQNRMALRISSILLLIVRTRTWLTVGYSLSPDVCGGSDLIFWEFTHLSSSVMGPENASICTTWALNWTSSREVQYGPIIPTVKFGMINTEFCL